MSTSKIRLHLPALRLVFSHPDYTVGIEITSILPNNGSRTIPPVRNRRFPFSPCPKDLYLYVIDYMIAFYRGNFKVSCRLYPIFYLPFMPKYDSIFKYSLRGTLMTCARSSGDRAPVSGTGCVGSIPTGRTSKTVD